MTIQSAILGILSGKPSTGYELKKIFEESSFMPWSGNNNQIYKALIALENAGLVSGEVVVQDTAPAKKIYTATPQGLAELKGWLMSSPEPPELKHLFLVQLAWSSILSDQELGELLAAYEEKMSLQLIMETEKQRRAALSPGKSPREILVQDMIFRNILCTYQTELEWIRSAKERLSALRS